MNNQPINAGHAAQLLQNGRTISTRVHESIDLRTQALIRAGMAAALFIYIVTYLVVFGGGISAGRNSATFSNTLLLPFLLVGGLTLGVRDTVRDAVREHRAFTTVIDVLALVPFGIAIAATVLGAAIPWGVGLGVAICATLPTASLAIMNERRARASAVRPAVHGARLPLSMPARAVTVLLALILGLATAAHAVAWGAIIGLILSAIVLALVLFRATPWNLASVGAEWGQAQWCGFTASFALLMGATMVVARTSLDSPVGVVAGVLAACPLAVSAFRGSRIHTRAEEFWDAPAAQS